MGNFTAFILILSNLLGTLFCGISAYCGLASYYKWGVAAPKSGEAITMKPYLWMIMMGFGILLLISTLVIGYRVWIQTTEKAHIDTATKFIKWPDPYNPISVVDKTFINDKVLLDGYAYDHCTFINVTFIYNATTPFHFNYNTVRGPIVIRSDNLAVNATVVLIDGLIGIPNLDVITPPGVIYDRRKQE